MAKGVLYIMSTIKKGDKRHGKRCVIYYVYDCRRID